MAEIIPEKSGAQTERLASLDALRGFNLFWILGANALICALNRLGHCAPTRFLQMEFTQSDWQGLRCYDLIFPLFIFIMGVAAVFSLNRIIRQQGRGAAVKRVVRRSVLLFIIGVLYSGGVSHPWPDVRLMGALNRIALCYFCGGLMFIFLPVRALVGVAAALLIGYWAMMKYAPVRDIQLEPIALAQLADQAGKPQLAAQFRAIDPDSNNPSAVKDSPVMAAARQMFLSTTNTVKGKFDEGCNVASHFDFQHLPGRLNNVFWDSDGLLSTLPAIATALFGIFAGLFLTEKSVPDERKVFWLFALGVTGVIIGFFWGGEFPVIAKIWTSSCALVAGGYSAILLGLFYWMVDMKQWRLWSRPLVWLGLNPLALYLVANLLGGEGYHQLAFRFAGGSVLDYLNARVAPGFGDVVVSLIGIGLFFCLANFLYRRRIFLRL